MYVQKDAFKYNKYFYRIFLHNSKHFEKLIFETRFNSLEFCRIDFLIVILFFFSQRVNNYLAPPLSQHTCSVGARLMRYCLTC